VVEDVVIESEVTAGDDINTGILLDLPVSKTQTLGLGEEVSLGDLAAPVGFSGLLEVTVHTHAGETEDSGLNHLAGYSCYTVKSRVRGIAAVMLLFQMGQEAGRYPIDI
jgi:hypothetical protein